MRQGYPGNEAKLAVVFVHISSQLVVKVKHRRIMRHMTLGSHSISLSSLKLINDLGEESAGRRWVGEGWDGRV